MSCQCCYSMLLRARQGSTVECGPIIECQLFLPALQAAGCCRLSWAGGCVQLQQQLIAAKNLCLCKSFVAVDQVDHGNPGGHLPCTQSETELRSGEIKQISGSSNKHEQGRHDQQMRSFERGYVFELFNINKISLYQTPPYQRFKIFQIF